MRHLDRGKVTVPVCLSRFRHGKNRWEDLSFEDREEVRARLELLQGTRCAYCERNLMEGAAPHIEHFERRHHAPKKSFDWNNLFWSCSHPGHCGCHKDNADVKYQSSDLLKPDVDEPRKFLFFAKDGTVIPREGLGNADHHRAKETIRVFRLDHANLVALRRAHLAGPDGELQTLRSEGLETEELAKYAALLLEDYAGLPFSAAILDILGIKP